MADIVLATLNARYIHTAFGLRYLLSNLGPLRDQARLIEFDLKYRPIDVAEALLACGPKIIGLGVYIWNAAPMAEVVAILKRIAPNVVVILGGPEVSYEVDQQPLIQWADYVITGEADLKFAEVCRQLLSGNRPPQKVIPAELPDLNQVILPYAFYEDRDIRQRMIYVEASRGCPFSCEFCLSSLEVPVRQFPLPLFLEQMQNLLDRGTRHFKFVDRTFNLHLRTGQTILEFFLARYQPGIFLHFEMIPDRLPEALRALIVRFPPGSMQFEVGIQTFNGAVSRRIQRRQNDAQVEDNFHFLRQQTHVHLHADLIAGLPGETLESFAAGFDRLVALHPQEIQVGILKRLRGTPIVRHDTEWQMVYNPQPPYEILQNKNISFADMQRVRRFARIWDLVANSGNFVEITPELWAGVGSPFAGFMQWCEWLHSQTGQTHGIPLSQLYEFVFQYLTVEKKRSGSFVAEVLWRDYQRGGRNDKPVFLRPFLAEASPARKKNGQGRAGKRQTRHRGLAVPIPDQPNTGVVQTAIASNLTFHKTAEVAEIAEVARPPTSD